MTQDDISKKGVGQSDLAGWHFCREYSLRRDETAGDNLNGSIPLSQGDLKAAGAELGGQVRLHVETGVSAIDVQKSIYSSQPGVGLRKEERQHLGLDPGNNTIEYWIKKIDENEFQTNKAVGNSSSNASTRDATQQELSVESENAEQQYVWLRGANSTTYHHIDDGNDSTTTCGIDFESRNSRIFTDPGDVLDECKNCTVRTSDKVTNEELAEWIANQAGFGLEGGPPGYFNKSQLLSIRDYIVGLQNNQLGEGPPNETD